jgi:hypothetical protein
LDNDRDDGLISSAGKDKANGSNTPKRSLSECCIVEFDKIDTLNETQEREEQTSGANCEKKM